MGQSYLFPGMDTEHLSPWQRQLEKLYDQVDRPGHRIASSQFFNSPEYQQFIIGQFGEIPVPPGAEVISRSPLEVRYKDAEGYEHVLTRNVSGGAEGGQITENTNRPPILPTGGGQPGLLDSLIGGARGLSEQQLANLLAQARGEKPAAFDPGIQGDLDQILGLVQKLSGPTQLLELDEGARAAFAAQSAAEQARLRQQFEQDQATQLANLFGNRINQSSIATNALGQLLKQQGLVSQQQQSDAYMRELQARIALTEEERIRLGQALQGLASSAGARLEGFRASTGAGQAQQNALNALLAELSGQQTTRDIASAGLGLDYKKFEEAIRQFNKNYGLESTRIQTEQEKLDAQGGFLNNLLKVSQAVANFTGAAGGGLSALRALGVGRNASGISGAGSTWPQN